MAGELVLIKHDDRAGPGWLLDRCVALCDFFRVIKIEGAGDLPPPNECNGVVFTSHSIDVRDIAARDPLLREELVFVRTLIGLGVPFLGIDGGAQLLARSMFGEIHEEKSEAIGAGSLTLSKPAHDDPLLGEEMGEELPVVLWPTHRISLPKRATLLAGSTAEPQAFRLGEWTYGLLPHLEATPLMFSEWLEELFGSSEQHREHINQKKKKKALEAEVEARAEAQRAFASRVMDRFIERTRHFCHVEPAVKDSDEPVLPH